MSVLIKGLNYYTFVLKSHILHINLEKYHAASHIRSLIDVRRF